MLLLSQNAAFANWQLLWNGMAVEDRVNLLLTQASNDSRLLHCTAQKSSPETWRMVWSLYKDLDTKFLIALLNEKNQAGKTVFHYAAGNPNHEVLRDVLTFLPSHERLPALLVADKEGKISLIKENNIESEGIFPTLWEIFTEDKDRLQLLQQCLNIGGNLLHISSHPAVLKTIVDFLPQEKVLSIVQPSDILRESPLKLMIKLGNVGSLKFIWENISAEEQIILFTKDTGKEDTLLQYAIIHGALESCEFILQKLPELSIPDLLKERNKKGDILLHALIKQGRTEILTCLLGKISKEERLKILMEKDAEANTALHLAAKSNINGTSSLLALLGYLSSEELLFLVSEPNIFGKTIIQIAAEYKIAEYNSPDRLTTLLLALPKASRLVVLTENNRFGDSPLQQAAKNPNHKVWDSLSKLLSQEDRKKLLDDETRGSQYALSFWKPKPTPKIDTQENTSSITTELTLLQESLARGFVGF